ncbi:GNAT family N-acetyltransferase [Stagnihabitans tardus]|uniref:GNAT family N-acetyltransferase n=1 Tax=Stagnihabitans tardus TaxID=2699202 RepID=A0AAE5BU08_9RHOB|nr:GNAT family N-acetyltransferase [Stagnihabitans tardus]NBZ86299.1 GNAT family N-acetyltransferase [Stagnihabitans tardus]
MIRPATVLDAQAIAAIWNPFIENSAVTFNPVVKRPEDVAEMIVARTTAGHGFLVAADEEGAILGFATYAQFRSGLGYSKTMEHTIILAPTEKGRGMGRALMTAIEAHAREEGAHQMIAGVSAENVAGLRFHEAMGYAEAARIREAGWKFGRYMDLVLMQKFL